MKHIPNIAGGLLGLAFLVFGLNHFLHFLPDMPAPEKGSPPALFFGAIYPTGYLGFIKIFEILGGIAVAIPKTRNIGLLLLGPVVVNILAFHLFLTNGGGLLDPVVIAISALSAYLLWVGRKKFCGLLND
jgi:putative oxidoreductase